MNFWRVMEESALKRLGEFKGFKRALAAYAELAEVEARKGLERRLAEAEKETEAIAQEYAKLQAELTNPDCPSWH